VCARGCCEIGGARDRACEPPATVIESGRSLLRDQRMPLTCTFEGWLVASRVLG
jgi:hypothetical protein